MYRTIIVEDDPMVADIDRQYAERTGSIKVLRSFYSATEALVYLDQNDVDLVILDYYMPEMNGMEFLKALRSRGSAVSVIMVTAQNNIERINAIMRLGIVDYLIKPFAYSRFQQAIEKFVALRNLSSSDGSITQKELDRALNSARTETRRDTEFVTKGIHPVTLRAVREYLAKHRNEPLTIQMISENVFLSRITVRNYMNYLVEHNEATSQINYHTGGRPSTIYFYKE